MAVCPTCHQHIASERLGVRLPPFKARIVDLIKAAGEIGISSVELHSDLYRGYSRHRSLETIKAHIKQINDALAATSWHIASDGRGRSARWCLRRVA